jgi:hypothetical protein
MSLQRVSKEYHIKNRMISNKSIQFRMGDTDAVRGIQYGIMLFSIELISMII